MNRPRWQSGALPTEGTIEVRSVTGRTYKCQCTEDGLRWKPSSGAGTDSYLISETVVVEWRVA